MYFREATAAFLVMSVSSRSSFEALDKWMTTIDHVSPTPIPVVLLANKVDLDESSLEVSMAEIEGLAAGREMPHFATSAVTGAGIISAMSYIASRCVPRTAQDSRSMLKPANSKRSRCCK